MPDYLKQEKAQELAPPGLLLCIIWIHLILLPTGIIAYAESVYKTPGKFVSVNFSSHHFLSQNRVRRSATGTFKLKISKDYLIYT